MKLEIAFDVVDRFHELTTDEPEGILVFPEIVYSITVDGHLRRPLSALKQTIAQLRFR